MPSINPSLIFPVYKSVYKSAKATPPNPASTPYPSTTNDTPPFSAPLVVTGFAVELVEAPEDVAFAAFEVEAAEPVATATLPVETLTEVEVPPGATTVALANREEEEEGRRMVEDVVWEEEDEERDEVPEVETAVVELAFAVCDGC